MKKMKIVRWFSLCLVLVVLLTGREGITARADGLPYDTYNYDYRQYIHYTPAAYVPEKTVTGNRVTYQGESIGVFSNPQDFCIDDSGRVYVADTNNNRIVVLNSEMTEVERIITTFINGGTEDSFNQPYGVCVSQRGYLYVADSRNHRIVVLNETDEAVQIISDPQSESLEENFVFIPLKVTVDYADRVYVIAQNMFEGIMVFENDGNFSCFFGTISVKITLWEKFWKRVATKEERSKQKLYIPTEFTGIDIDPEGFVYATNIDSTGLQGVRRMNPKGEDVIKKGVNENVGGDLQITGDTDYAGPSQFTDVVYRNSGIYSCLDRKRGRIFTYDQEGNLLYIFGGLGTQEGTFQMPVAIEEKEGKILVLDSARASILSFKVTEYGQLINQAVALRYSGDETEAVGLWERVLELDENNELANTGIGKAYLSAGDYEKALYYLKLGMNRGYYSVAYKRYRNEILMENADWFLTVAAVCLLAGLICKHVRKRRKGAGEDA